MSIFITCLCILIFGFILGVTYSAWVMCKKAGIFQKSIEIESKVNGKAFCSQLAISVAASCWCDPRMIRSEMDTTLGLVFAEKIMEYIHALEWCSASPDFQKGGKDVEGFDKICRPLILANIDVAQISPDTYRRFRENCPELIGLERRGDV